MTERLTVAIVDDHAILRAGLRLLLEAAPDMEVVGEAGEAGEALSMIRDARPDVVLLDISLPGTSGLELVSRIRSLSPDSRILILTMHEDTRYLERALEEGAAGFLLKKAMDVELLLGIRTVARGEPFIHSSMVAGLLGAVQRRPRAEATEDGRDRALWGTLSPREQEVMTAVAHGHTSREIADRHHLSEKTVATYRSRAMAKLGISSRAELVDLVLRLGLMDRPSA
ncbi:response regulator transcription factor [Dissulfurirhabdus thermomarina]|uniref:Response regulator transcription factor n=1 Tax=Dissulfurirhabdus thermomarina TaxID=1765737 RepID=A0A6N9TP60_DISTH|nr:response regulator transcription factor [Dissulfurirhabdus thermomarina]NDY42949.1 response regulator transcription factor [Dissulfurirhabdus thermomarina]NMX23790.1 response regulator transcription factor [Dissulfurirhabdus thermomarina]